MFTRIPCVVNSGSAGRVRDTPSTRDASLAAIALFGNRMLPMKPSLVFDPDQCDSTDTFSL